MKNEPNKNSSEIKQVLDGIHALYISGKITMEQHNNLCFQAKKGVTAFEL